jgi:hypothetical protein
MKFDNLVCIYTCEEHKEFLRAFYRSAPGRHLLKLPSTKIFEVYASPNIQSSFHEDNRLVLRTTESYDTLSLKTFEMIRYCVEKFDFLRILKIDVTIVRRRIEGIQYTGRRPLDLEKVDEFLATLPIESEYAGYVRHERTEREQVIAWAAKKGGKINFQNIFGSDPVPPFYGGLCYCVGRAFAEFISGRGASMAREHSLHLMGAEDVMIGRLFKLFSESTNHVLSDEDLHESSKNRRQPLVSDFKTRSLMRSLIPIGTSPIIHMSVKQGLIQ